MLGVISVHVYIGLCVAHWTNEVFSSLASPEFPGVCNAAYKSAEEEEEKVRKVLLTLFASPQEADEAAAEKACWAFPLIKNSTGCAANGYLGQFSLRANKEMSLRLLFSPLFYSYHFAGTDQGRECL